MCSVGDGFNVEIGEDVSLCEYVCGDCGKQFKGIAITKMKCPTCHSTNTSKKE